MRKFIGRKEELKRLRLLTKKRAASFVVIRGRRRIGKSRLIEEFGRELPCHVITGYAPTEGVTKQMQLDEFCMQVADSFRIPRFRAGNWSEAFQNLAHHCSSGRMMVALDEISWMGSRDSRFLAHLKHAWDRLFSTNPELIFIVCGSVSSWIEKNILGHTGFVGRISLDMQLRELKLWETAQFWNGASEVSPCEIFKVLAVTGGVPRYLEELTPTLSAEENIRLLCFREDGLLFREFNNIFSELFSHRGPDYARVLRALAEGPKTSEELRKQLEINRKATVSEYVNDLRQAGFVSDDITWNLISQKDSRLKRHRLSDNYIRFYLRYVEPKRGSIQKGRYKDVSLFNLPSWDAVMGLQFENLVVQNASALFDALHINPADVVHWGPYFQRSNQRQEGCQVDLLIQLSHGSLILCEVKFSQHPIGVDVAQEMNEKMLRLSTKKGWSKRSALVHVNGVSRDLEQSGRFQHIIDFSQLLQSSPN